MDRLQAASISESDINLANRLRALEEAEKTTDYAREHCLDASLHDKASMPAIIAICYALLNRKDEARRFGRLCVERSIEYFFGDWRLTYKPERILKNPNYWDQNMMWMWLFEHALFCAVLYAEETSLSRLIQFPNRNRHIDPGQCVEDRDVLVAFADFLKQKQFTNEGLTIAESLIAARSVRSRHIARILLAMHLRRAVEVEQCLNEYLEYYRRRELPDKDITKKISTMGTVLARLASQLNMPVSIGGRYAPYLM
jgi:hypothetical protein